MVFSVWGPKRPPNNNNNFTLWLTMPQAAGKKQWFKYARKGWWRKQSRAAQGTHNSFSTSVHTHFRLSFIHIWWWWKYLPSRDVKKKASKRGRVRLARKIENGQSESSPLRQCFVYSFAEIHQIFKRCLSKAVTPSFF